MLLGSRDRIVELHRSVFPTLHEYVDKQILLTSTKLARGWLRTRCAMRQPARNEESDSWADPRSTEGHKALIEALMPREFARLSDNGGSQITCDIAVTAPTFSETAKHLWTFLGKKETDPITRAELDKAYKESPLEIREGAVLVLLRNHFDRVKDGQDITLSGLKKFDKMQEDARSESEIANALEQGAAGLFKDFDADKDNKINPKEIAEALKKAGASETRAFERLEKKFDDIQKKDPDRPAMAPDGISTAALERYVSEMRTNPEDDLWFGGILNRTLRQATDKRTCGDLYSDSVDPVKSIKPQAVIQGGIGNCYFLSALSSLAEIDPEAIPRMIKDNKDGTYTVTFPHAPKEPITIAKPTGQELFTYARANEFGIWPAVMEKAYGTWAMASVWRRNPLKNLYPSNIPQENADGGSMTHHGLKMLTDSSADVHFFAGVTKPDALHKVLVDAFKDKKPVTIFSSIGKQMDPAVPTGHEYSVLGYDEKTKTVTIRNPWGSTEPMTPWASAKDGKNDGVFTLPLDEAMKKFIGLAAATKRAP